MSALHEQSIYVFDVPFQESQDMKINDNNRARFLNDQQCFSQSAEGVLHNSGLREE